MLGFACFVSLVASQAEIRAVEGPVYLGAITVRRGYPEGEDLTVVGTDFHFVDRDHFSIVQRPLKGSFQFGRGLEGVRGALVSALWVEDGNVIAYQAMENGKTVAVTEQKVSLKEFYDGLKTPPSQERLNATLPLFLVVAARMANLLPVRLQWGLTDWVGKVMPHGPSGLPDAKNYFTQEVPGRGGGFTSFSLLRARIQSQTVSVDYGYRMSMGHTERTDFYWGALREKKPVFKRPSAEELEAMRKVAGSG